MQGSVPTDLEDYVEVETAHAHGGGMHRVAKFVTAGGGMHAHERWVHCDKDGEQMFMKHHYAAQGRAEECDGHELWVHGDNLALKPCFLGDEKWYSALAKTLLAEKNAYEWVDEDLDPQQNYLSVLAGVEESYTKFVMYE